MKENHYLMIIMPIKIKQMMKIYIKILFQVHQVVIMKILIKINLFN